MTIVLSPDLQRFVEEQVAAGRFASPQEVIEAGVARLVLDPDPNSPMAGDELDAEDVAAIEESERQIAAGQDLDWKQVSAGLRRKYLGEEGRQPTRG